MKTTLFCALLLFATFTSCSGDDTTTTTQDETGIVDDDDGQTDTDGTSDCNIDPVFAINLDPNGCTIDIQAELGTTSQYSELINGTTRSITINGIGNHLVGQFPNQGNPNAIAQVSENYEMTTQPQLANTTTESSGYTAGIFFSGVVLEPYTAEFFTGPDGSVNRAWNITALQSTTPLGLDCNNAHVQPTGRYHYHGTPSNYLDGIPIDGTQMVKLGYAADGFPIYYKYGYDSDNITLIALESGYRIRTEDRGGDGIIAPSGCPDGYYFQDYEYVEGASALDECNGRMGRTPDADEEYYYVVTDNFPSLPLCFSGTPDSSFRF